VAEPYLICPSDWPVTTLKPDKASDYIRGAESGGTPSTTRDDFWDGDVPWLTPKEVTDLDGSIYVSRTARQITPAGLKRSGAKLMASGSVMLTKRAPVGSVVVNSVPMATNQGFMNFTLGPSLRPAFFAAWLRANRPYLDAVANGSTYPELYLSDLFEFQMSVPPLDYQDRVVTVINAFEAVLALESSLSQLVTSPEEMTSVQANARSLRALRDEMLPLIVSGQIDVSRRIAA
jgi:restriction endonuclease S subunit